MRWRTLLRLAPALLAPTLLAPGSLRAQTAASPATAPAPAPSADPIPVHTTFVVHSRLLGEDRTINVWTPARRAPTDTLLPVLYMLDGGLAEDFPHVVNTIDSLIELGRIAPVAVVGIENTERRRDLTGPTSVASDSTIARRVGGSAAFRQFLRDELMPEARARCRCSDERAIVGESLAGLFVVETFLLEPGLFQRYIALSPSVWWNGGELVRAAGRRSAALPDGRVVFLTAANEAQIADGTASIAATLRSTAAGLTLYHEPRPDLEHGTIFRGEGPAAFVRTLW